MGLGIGKRLKRTVKKVERTARKVGRETKKVTSQIGAEARRLEGKSEYAINPTAGAQVEAGRSVMPTAPGDIPTPEAPTAMPVPDDELARTARRRARQKRRGGRSSSILTGDTLG